MTEAGGPAAQSGIFYQNTITALFLSRMLDFRDRPARDRITQVRVEAPHPVDDIVATMGDGSRLFIQVKLSLSQSPREWDRLWTAFCEQVFSPNFKTDDRLVLIVGELSAAVNNLKECCERTNSTVDDVEYVSRLTEPQRAVVKRIESALRDESGSLNRVRKILSLLEIRIWTPDHIDQDLVPLWLPSVTKQRDGLLAILRDIASSGARRRSAFSSYELRKRLKADFDIDLREPDNWRASAYRDAIVNQAVIDIPGAAEQRTIDDVFVWPNAVRYDRNRRADFDDESFNVFGIRSDTVDLSRFPVVETDRTIVIAGAGHGKSVLMRASASRLAKEGLLPVIIPVPHFVRNDWTLIEHLDKEVNRTYDVSINWLMAIESGLVVILLDGLDEVSSERRMIALERLNQFTARFPNTPWMLTVRDAGALSAPVGAIPVELKPLDDAGIRQMVEAYCGDSTNMVDAYAREIFRRPDLTRLCRIPLFLAILITTARRGALLPKDRSELLENYVNLLLEPTLFRRTDRSRTDSIKLRQYVELLAFTALERGEIGITRQLVASIAMPEQSSTLDMVDDLIALGILKRGSPSRYEFPFPIIQEYLASGFLIKNHKDELLNRFTLTARRPWAQAIQFAMEQHPNPATIVDELLEVEDDAFFTTTRLIGRCVCNGMRLPLETYTKLADKLVHAWIGSHWSLRERLGAILSDGFTSPLVPSLRDALKKKWLLNTGSGAILSKINDSALTLEVLERLLDSDDHYLLNLGDFQEAVDCVSELAFKKYIDRARKHASDPSLHSRYVALIEHLSAVAIPEQARAAAIRDITLAPSIRLTVYGLSTRPVDYEAVANLVEDVLRNGASLELSAATRIIARSKYPAAAFKSAIDGAALDEKSALDLLDGLPWNDPSFDSLTFSVEVAKDESLFYELRNRARVFAARFGHKESMCSLLESLGQLPIDIVSAVISILGHYPDRIIGERVAKVLEERTLQPEDRVKLASGIVIGTTSLFEMDWFHSGTLSSVPPHPAISTFRAIVEMWISQDDYQPLDALRIETDCVLLGSKSSIDSLPHRIADVIENSGIDLADMDNASVVGHAISTLNDRNVLLDLNFLQRVINRTSFNGSARAVTMVASHGSDEAMDLLISLYDDASDISDAVKDAIESLSSRRGLRVTFDGGIKAVKY